MQFSNPQATWPGAVETALGSQIRRLGARAAALRNPPPLDVLANPGFERPAGRRRPDPRLGRHHAQRRQHPTGQDAEARRPAVGQDRQHRPGGLPGEPAVRRAGHRPAVDVRVAPRGRRRPAAAAAIGPGRKAPRARLLSLRPGRPGARPRPAGRAHRCRSGDSTSSRSTTCRWKGLRRSACGST